MNWQPIETAPLDGTEILIVANGMVIQARFHPGEWWDHHEYGKQYDGAIWCAFDDALEFEVEEGPNDSFYHGHVTHWAPLELPEKLNEQS